MSSDGSEKQETYTLNQENKGLYNETSVSKDGYYSKLKHDASTSVGAVTSTVQVLNTLWFTPNSSGFVTYSYDLQYDIKIAKDFNEEYALSLIYVSTQLEKIPSNIDKMIVDSYGSSLVDDERNYAEKGMVTVSDNFYYEKGDLGKFSFVLQNQAYSYGWPDTSNTEPIPEPATLLMLGLGSLLGFRRFKG